MADRSIMEDPAVRTFQEQRAIVGNPATRRRRQCSLCTGRSGVCSPKERASNAGGLKPFHTAGGDPGL